MLSNEVSVFQRVLTMHISLALVIESKEIQIDKMIVYIVALYFPFGHEETLLEIVGNKRNFRHISV